MNSHFQQKLSFWPKVRFDKFPFSWAAELGHLGSRAAFAAALLYFLCFFLTDTDKFCFPPKSRVGYNSVPSQKLHRHHLTFLESQLTFSAELKIKFQTALCFPGFVKLEEPGNYFYKQGINLWIRDICGI